MANYQNNMRCAHRPVQNLSSTCQSCRRMEGCPDTTDHFPAHMPIAMAYVPWQKWQKLYEPCKGFQRGTIFEELDKPFFGKGGMRR